MSAGRRRGFSRRKLLVSGGVGTALLATGNSSAARAAASAAVAPEEVTLFGALADALRGSPDLVMDDASIAKATEQFAAASASWPAEVRASVVADLRRLTGARAGAAPDRSRDVRRAALEGEVGVNAASLRKERTDGGSYGPDGTLRAVLGHECPIGGGEPPCAQGIFDPAARPLSLAPLAAGGVLVEDPGLSAIHGFTADGARLFSCSHPLGQEPLVAIAVDGGTVLIAGTSTIAISHLTAAKVPGCRPASVRIEQVRRHRASLEFTLSQRARVQVRLQRVRRFDCASLGLPPSRAAAGCATLSGPRERGSQAGVRGINRVHLPRGSWLVTISAGEDAVIHVRT